MPLALVTLGTTFTGDLGFFSWSAQAAARAGMLPVVVVGWNPMPPESKTKLIAALPKGTRLLNFVPFDQVLPRLRLMIHHGGMGTTHAALIHGIPQVVVPHAADQRGQARRVAQAKVGLNLTALDVRQGMLFEGVKALASDENVRRTARDLAAELASHSAGRNGRRKQWKRLRRRGRTQFCPDNPSPPTPLPRRRGEGRKANGMRMGEPRA